MADRALSTFEIKKAGEGYTLHIEDDAGDKIEFTATAEQLDVISERLIELLDDDDSVSGSADGDED